MKYEELKNILEKRQVLTKERRKIYEIRRRIVNNEARGFVRIEMDGEVFGVESIEFMEHITEVLGEGYQKKIDEIDEIHLRLFVGNLEENNVYDQWVKDNLEERKKVEVTRMEVKE